MTPPVARLRRAHRLDVGEIALLVGTRPEAIKLAPLAAALRAQPGIRPRLIASGQHTAVVDEALAAFGEAPAARLALRRVSGGQSELVSQITEGLEGLFAERRPSALVVHGDTSTTLAGALAAFWQQIPVVHLEAGLRSGDLESPFPEEANRKLVGQLARLHLAPTPLAVANLRHEGVPEERILLTGNTVVDAVLHIAQSRLGGGDPRISALVEAARRGEVHLALLTAHRRESWGAPLDRILSAVRRLVARHPELRILAPSHPNPAVRAQLEAGLGGLEQVLITDPLPYPELTRVLAASRLVLSDSGGIQEEAPSFGVPVLVLRDVTERVEALAAGCAELVGTDPERILARGSALLARPSGGAPPTNPFGDGHAAEYAAEAIAALVRTPVLAH